MAQRVDSVSSPACAALPLPTRPSFLSFHLPPQQPIPPSTLFLSVHCFPSWPLISPISLHNVHQQLPAFLEWLTWLPPSSYPAWAALPNSSPTTSSFPLCPALSGSTPNEGTIMLIKTKIWLYLHVKFSCLSGKKSKYQQKHHHTRPRAGYHL